MNLRLSLIPSRVKSKSGAILSRYSKSKNPSPILQHIWASLVEINKLNSKYRHSLNFEVFSVIVATDYVLCVALGLFENASSNLSSLYSGMIHQTYILKP